MTITLPNGKRVVIAQIAGYDYNQSYPGVVTISHLGSTPAVQHPANNAQQFLEQLDAAMLTPETPVTISDPGFPDSAWSSITPNINVEVGSLQVYVIAGAFPQTPTALKLDDGNGNVVPLTIDTNPGRTTTTQITTLQASLPSAANPYLLYWSNDGGTTWTVTSLTVGAQVVSLTWTSITPNTVAVNAFFDFAVAGTGFNASGINLMELDNGAGNKIDYVSGALVINSDISMTLRNGELPVAGTYTLYYSTDGGRTRTTTGLTVVAS